MGTWTQADHDNLKAAIASGVLQVRYDGPPARQITYHSLTEMRALLAEMRREIGGSVTYRLVQTRKGF